MNKHQKKTKKTIRIIIHYNSEYVSVGYINPRSQMPWPFNLEQSVLTFALGVFRLVLSKEMSL